MSGIRAIVVVIAGLAAAVVAVGHADGQTPVHALHVGPDQPLRTVTEAIAVADPGAEIVVHGSTYHESTIVVDKSLTLRGVDWPVLDGQGERQIMTVVADDVTISGFVFRNVGVSYIEDRAAIKIDDAEECVVAGNRFEDAFFGVYLARVRRCAIRDNVFRGSAVRETSSGNGIHLWYSGDVVIEGNEISGHRDGIYLEFAEDIVVQKNTSAANLRYGLHFMFSDRCHYEGNVFRDNGAGVAVMYASDVTMVENIFQDNWGSAAYGLLLKEIDDSRVHNNTFVRNTVGMYAEGVDRVTVLGNLFEANGWAIKIMANSIDNTFVDNDFVANTFDVATNSRASYSRFERNYWDQYEGYDLDADGLGDVAFRPVRLFSMIVERHEPALILLRSPFVDLLDASERMLPVLTPETLVDATPRMHRNQP